MNEVLYTKTFNEWQQELDTELVKSAESFVKIGYLLKVARDTDILVNSGYGNVVEFAKARYGLDKTQVSRFIHINDISYKRQFSFSCRFFPFVCDNLFSFHFAPPR